MYFFPEGKSARDYFLVKVITVPDFTIFHTLGDRCSDFRLLLLPDGVAVDSRDGTLFPPSSSDSTAKSAFGKKSSSESNSPSSISREEHVNFEYSRGL